MRFLTLCLMCLWFIFGCQSPGGDEEAQNEESVVGVEEAEQPVMNWTALSCLKIKGILDKDPLDFGARSAWSDKQCCNVSATCAGYAWWELPGSGSVCDVQRRRCFEPCNAATGYRVGTLLYCGGNTSQQPYVTCVESGIPDKCTLVDACTGVQNQVFYPEGCR